MPPAATSGAVATNFIAAVLARKAPGDNFIRIVRGLDSTVVREDAHIISRLKDRALACKLAAAWCIDDGGSSGG